MMKNFRFTFMFGSVASLCSAACSSETSTSMGPDSYLAVPGSCGAYAHEPCDTTLADCQARLAEIATCQWGGPGASVVLPSITVATLEEVEQRFAELSSDSEPAPSAVDEVLTLLGLIEAGDLGMMETVEREAAFTAAFYEFEARTITIVDRGDEVDLIDANATLLHEFIHALQNEQHDLLELQRDILPTLDGVTALRGLFEGEASFHEAIFYLAQADVPLTSLAFDIYFGSYRSFLETELFEGPDVFLSANALMPYVYGASWAYAEWTRGGSEVVQSRYDIANLPESTLQILQLAWAQPEDTSRLAEYPMPNVFYDGAPPAEDSEVIPVVSDRLGAYTTYVMARIHGDGTHASSREISLAWLGDQLDIFELDAGGFAGRWTLNFETEAAAAAFGGALESNPNLSIRRDGATLVAAITAGGQSAPEWLFGALAR